MSIPDFSQNHDVATCLFPNHRNDYRSDDTEKNPKNVLILGSTGSIGINTLKVIERFPNRFKVFGLTAYNNVKRLIEQTKKFSPQCIAIHPNGMADLKRHIFSRGVKILDVESDVNDLVCVPEVDIVVIAMRGSAALKPFLNAVRAGKTVTPANKEALVIAGDIIMKEAKKHQAKIIPIDSEQSAIFQCLDTRDRSELKKIYLTASGGPLHNVRKNELKHVTLKQILRHPRWKMGKKITVDSATLMNKGFEVIEAQRLFGVAVDQIEVIIHPEAMIHSMVEFQDGSILAQLAVTDMRLPIQYALTYPRRYTSGLKSMNFFELRKFTFYPPDHKRFPSLKLCYHVARKGGTMPSVLNAADEEAVEAFLKENLKFSEIFSVVEKVILNHKNTSNPSCQEILDADQWAREEIKRYIK